jgi:F0F1-type ATP synthase membrane subunit b/b'
VRIFIPKFNQTIEKRVSKIRYDIEQAEWMNEQSRLLFENNQKKIEDAQKQVENLIKETLSDLELKKKTQLAHIDNELSLGIKAMEKSFERQQISLQSQIESIAVNCVDDILQHLINMPSSVVGAKNQPLADEAAHGTH